MLSHPQASFAKEPVGHFQYRRRNLNGEVEYLGEERVGV